LSLLVKLTQVNKIYHTHDNEFHALKNIDFHLLCGEMMAIIGASGSGKSTLMNILGFLDRCTSGIYWFGNDDVSHLSDEALAKIRNQKIGFVFQSFFLLPRFNALQNVMLPLFYRGTEIKLAKEKSKEMLAKVGMEKFISHKPNQLSGGQQQRVAIARALVGDPQIILADEPTGALDSKTGQEVMDLFINLNQKENRTIVLITHDASVSRQCQRIVSLKDGSLIP
jgi:putative ABC transport system ATP-binding protein